MHVQVIRDHSVTFAFAPGATMRRESVNVSFLGNRARYQFKSALQAAKGGEDGRG